MGYYELRVFPQCRAWHGLGLQERLHNFFNNRKPKDLKKPRTPIPPTTLGAVNGDVSDANGAAAESQSGDSERQS